MFSTRLHSSSRENKSLANIYFSISQKADVSIKSVIIKNGNTSGFIEEDFPTSTRVSNIILNIGFLLSNNEVAGTEIKEN